MQAHLHIGENDQSGRIATRFIIRSCRGLAPARAVLVIVKTPESLSVLAQGSTRGYRVSLHMYSPLRDS